MTTEPEDEIRLSERDLRALAMDLALRLPRHEADASRVLDLMRAGYEFFLCEMERPKGQKGDVVRPRFRR